MVCGTNLWTVCHRDGSKEDEGYAILQMRLDRCEELLLVFNKSVSRIIVVIMYKDKTLDSNP